MDIDLSVRHQIIREAISCDIDVPACLQPIDNNERVDLVSIVLIRDKVFESQWIVGRRQLVWLLPGCDRLVLVTGL
jgi:hypothetical protein